MQQIWAKDLRDEMNVALVFSHTITVAGTTVLRLASNVAFRVWINGGFFSYGPRRKAHGKAAINEYNLQEYAGQSIKIDVECVSYRVENFYIVNQVPFFAAEIEQNGEIVANSSDFQAYRNASRLQKVQRFAQQRGFVEAYKMDGKATLIPIETDEQTVCVLEKSGVPYPQFTYLKAEEFESGNVFEKSVFEEYDDSYLNRRNAKRYSREEQEYRITLENDRYGFEKTNEVGEELFRQYKAYRLPRNAAGFIALDIEVLDDANVMLNYDEKLSAVQYTYCEKFRSDSTNETNFSVDRSATYLSGASNIDVYRLHSISLINYKLTRGRYALIAFEPDQMQYIRAYVISGRVRIHDIALLTYENEEVKLKFHCEDEDLNLIFQSAINTFKANAVDVLTDCASRERAGWLCDSYFSGRAEKIITGNNSIEKNTIEAFRDYRTEFCKSIPKEAFPMCYPSDHTVQGRYIPNWCMWFILELESYQERGGDRKLVEELREKVLTFVDFELTFLNNDGLLENLDGWIFVEWSRANDLTQGVNYPTNMLFSTVLKAVAKLYNQPKCADIAKKMDEQIVAQSFNGKFFVDNAVRDEKGNLVLNTEWTETCQYYAFWCGHANKEKYPELFKIVFEEIHDYSDLSDKYANMSRSDSFIGLYLRLDYLSRIGENEKLLNNLKDFFLFQAKETTSFWEYKTPSASCCHAFASIMCEWILKAVLGVEKIDDSGISLTKDCCGKMDAEAEIPYGDKIFAVKHSKEE